MSKLIIGTANFLNNYNGTSVSLMEAIRIRDTMKENSLNLLDTSPHYGNAEDLLYKWFKEFSIITKVDGDKDTTLDKILLYGILLHSFDDFYNYYNIVIKNSSSINYLGCSIYHEYEFHTILESKARLDIIQLPHNIINPFPNFEFNFNKCRNEGIQIHARSIFGRNSIPDVDKRKAFDFVYQNELIDYVVVGVNNANQLKEIISWT